MSGPLRLPERPGPVAEEPWRVDAACRGIGTDLFYPAVNWSFEGKLGPIVADEVARAKAVCASCPVCEACLDYAIGASEPEGIFGGLDPRERRSLTNERRTA